MKTRIAFLVLAAATALASLAVAADAAQYKPDNMVKLQNKTAFKGQGVFNTTAIGQGVGKFIPFGGSAKFTFKCRNKGTSTDDLYLYDGSLTGTSWHQTYTVKGVDVTGQVKNGNPLFNDVPPGGTRTTKLTVQHDASLGTAQDSLRMYTQCVSQGSGNSAYDVVQAAVFVLP